MRAMRKPLLLIAATLLTSSAQAAELKPCRLRGIEHEALCGVIARALDPAQPQRAANTGASRPQPQQARDAAANRSQQRPQGGARPSR